jgi:NADH:ubiquinone oxidoreductase subunit F (NADH-binding)
MTAVEAPAPELRDAPPAGARLLAGTSSGRVDRRRHLALHGALDLPSGPDRAFGPALAAALGEAGLRGRGGAGFPTGAKLETALVARRSVIVVNAMEGEPASAKDEVLGTAVPHLVLDGALALARAARADQVHLCVARGRPAVAASYRTALAERAGHDPADVVVTLQQAPDGFVTGEESALVAWLNGAEARPTFRPDRPPRLPLGRSRALVDNAETVAQVALIARHGPAWWRSAPPAGGAGTTLVTLSGALTRPGVYEVPLGTPLGAVLDGAGAAPGHGAVLTGGFGGAWLDPAARAVPLSPEDLTRAGATLGAGVLAVLPRGACGLAETARVLRYLAGQSAGQCGPCVFGLPALAEDLEALAAGRGDRRSVARLTARLPMVEGRGACRHPDGAVRLVRSALAVFAADLAAHAAGRPCAGARRPGALAVPAAGPREWS